MQYLKINGLDFSPFAKDLKVSTAHNYTSQTNAAGNSVVDYINSKREIEVGIIPVTAAAMKNLQQVFDTFSVSVSFLNPNTNEIEENVACIIPSNSVEYYTIQQNKTLFKAFNFKLIEL